MCKSQLTERHEKAAGLVAQGELTNAAICEQVASGSWKIFGAMLESHLVEGRQDYVPGQHAMYGQSITDACISLQQTEPLLEAFAAAQQKRA